MNTNSRTILLALLLVGEDPVVLPAGLEIAAFVVLIAGSTTSIEAGHLVTPVTAFGVDGLVRCNRVKPGANLATRLEVFALQVDLEKRGLERVVGHLGIAEVASEVVEQLALVAVDQRVKGPAITVTPIREQEVLVGPLGVGNGL